MDLLKLSTQVEEKYRGYLRTTFHFKDPELRASFNEALRSEYLKRGPYLEATPVFKQGGTPKGLFESLLGFIPDRGFLEAVHGDRPLYEHQAKAIHAAFHGRNAIVATGTGSGKTESFLYPILLHLYQEFVAGKLGPGVRALILYPMNALANDQRNRLGEIANRLIETHSIFRFSFGQYIGETPEDEKDSRRFAREHLSDRLPGELVLRSEIRESPPHILLTNFSMLEYLLLRPDDSPLFDKGNGRSWKFIVLDEAHQYRGAMGIEMAMLLRRLKQRIRAGGRVETFSCIGTSATLVGGEGDRAAVAAFACDLFGEEFHETEVILGTTMPISELSDRSLPPEAYDVLAAALANPQGESRSALTKYAVYLGARFPDETSIPALVSIILLHDMRATRLRREISNSPSEVKKIASLVFAELPEEEQLEALSKTVELLLRSQDPTSCVPLLSARYHLFLRSLEGAFASYWPGRKVFLDRKSVTSDTSAFEVALCRECGQHYFVGRIVDGKFLEAIRDPGQPDFGSVFLRPVRDVPEENEDDDDDDDSNGNQNVRYILCIRCGRIASGNLPCDHGNPLLVIKEDASANEDRANQISKCSVCGYRSSGRDPVRAVLHGTDGPNAVIATALYQNLPDGRKKVLAFADARQEAAFFAWYLEESYRDIMARNCILKALRLVAPHSKEGISLRTLADHLLSEFSDIFRDRESDDDLKIRMYIWRAIYREYLTDEWRISLEGVGLLKWFVKLPSRLSIPDWMGSHPWSFSEEDANVIISLLLNFMRLDRAVELRTERGVSLQWSDLGLQAQQMSVVHGPPRRPAGARNWSVRSWDGRVGRRVRFLAKLLQKKGFPEAEALDYATSALERLWETFQKSDRDAPSPDERLLISVNDSKRLNPEWWRLLPIGDNDTVFQCNTCGRLQPISGFGLCTRHNCRGILEQIRLNDSDSNHYRNLYSEDLPGALRVEEHTAQLGHEKAREFQSDFKQGKIHVLSCSTTFELGVDLGDLDTVFLRNVPPEAFNYAQRVGRSGRRKGYPGFALTYCRRNSHDLYHFVEPERILSGRVRPPTLSLQNEKIITRHMVATALSSFFRNFRERFKTVQDFVRDFNQPALIKDFLSFLNDHREVIQSILYQIVPQEMHSRMGLNDESWVSRIAGEGSRLFFAESELANDLRIVHEFEARASSNRDYRSARWAQKRAETIAREDVLSALSRKAVIPKYGFPVDVVQLDTFAIEHGAATEVSLQRDLSIAISEFAPKNRLIANKNVWTSYGIKRLIDKEWDRRTYRKCNKHNFFESWQRGNIPTDIQKCCDKMVSGEFIIPQFGFVTNREEPKRPTGRTSRLFSTRPYFLHTHEQSPGSLDFGSIKLTKASPGVMVVLCEGQRGHGFYICEKCGAGSLKRDAQHKTPYGEQCQGTLTQVSLGHEFTTDVVQLQFADRPMRGIEPLWFTYSLAYSLLESAAEVMEIPSSDLNATVAYRSIANYLPPVILYDNLPGGAGLVARLQDKGVLYDCLVMAQKRVNGDCGCAEATSCYGCLRGYRNQFAHPFIQRGPVKLYLEQLISEWH